MLTPSPALPASGIVHPADACAVAQAVGREALYQWHETSWRYHRPPHVFTCGYGNRPALHLFQEVRNYRAFVLDIRLQARSSRPEWCEAELSTLFGVRYEHLPCLGNIHYQEREQGIAIADLQGGLACVESHLKSGHWPILLCGCGEEHGWHRAGVADALRERGWRVGEMPWGTYRAPAVATPERID